MNKYIYEYKDDIKKVINENGYLRKTKNMKLNKIIRIVSNIENYEQNGYKADYCDNEYIKDAIKFLENKGKKEKENTGNMLNFVDFYYIAECLKDILQIANREELK